MEGIELNTMSPEMLEQVNDSALLNVLMYLDLEGANVQNGDDVLTIITKLGPIYEAADGDSDYKMEKQWYQALVNAVEHNPHLGNYEIGNQSHKMINPSYEAGGLKAATFSIDGDNNGNPDNVVFVYRGTGAGEWLDNGTGLGGAVNYTEQQKEAQEYFDRVIEENQWNTINPRPIIDVSGHSKGGNKAQFVAMTAEHADLIRNCYSFDGQGMSPEAIEWMRTTLGEEEFNKRREKLYSFSAENDFVNILGERLVPLEHVFYLEFTLPKGGAEWHYPDAYLTEDGKLAPFKEQGEISNFLESMSEQAMDLPAPIRNVVTEGLMGMAHYLLGEGDPVNGGEVSFAEIGAAIPLFVQMIPGAAIDYIGDKFGVNLDWLSNVVNTFAVIYFAPITLLGYGIGAVIDWAIPIITECIEKLKQLAEMAVELTTKLIAGFEKALNDLKNWFNTNFNPGFQYATAHPELKVDTYKLRNYAQQLQSINNRISNIDRRLDSLYTKIDLLDLWDLLQADLVTGECWKINRVVSYLMDTAHDFEAAERKIMNTL